MANLASSAVTPGESYNGFASVPPKKYAVREGTMVLTGQGGSTNKIPASVFNLSSIKGALPVVKNNNLIVVMATPSYDGSYLLLTSAASDAPGDISGTFSYVVWGPSA